MTPRPHQLPPRLLIFLTVFIDLLGFGIIIPILPLIGGLLVEDARFQGSAGALLMVAFSLLQMIFSPIWGRLSDRYGRRPILLMSLACSTTSYVLFALSQQYWLLLVSRLIAGIGGANITAAQAYMADITDSRDRTAAMGMIGMAFGLGFALGPVIGGGATHLWEWLFPAAMAHQGAGVVAALICGANLVGAIFLLPESLAPERRGQASRRRFATLADIGATLTHRSIGPLMVLFFLVTFAFAKLEITFSLYAGEVLGLPVRAIYGLFVFLGLSMAFWQGWFVRRAVRFVPEPVLAVGGIGCLTAALLMFPLVASVPWMLLSIALLSFGQGIAMPSVMSLISRSATGDRQGRVLGVSQSAGSLARIVGPLLGGPLFDLGPSLPFLAAALAMAFALGWAVMVRRRLIRYGMNEETRGAQVERPTAALGAA